MTPGTAQDGKVVVSGCGEQVASNSRKPAVLLLCGDGPPVTVPTVSNWAAGQGSYVFDHSSCVVARDGAALDAADTLSGDLRGRATTASPSSAAPPEPVTS